jgi:uncharacterized protein
VFPAYLWDMTKATERQTAVKSCAICGKPQDEKFRPFCSKRCADVDLHRWLSGTYAIPVKESEDEDGERGTPKPPDDAA